MGWGTTLFGTELVAVASCNLMAVLMEHMMKHGILGKG